MKVNLNFLGGGMTPYYVSITALLTCSFALQAEDAVTNSIHGAIQSGTYSAVHSAIIDSSAADIIKADQDLNSFMERIPHDQAVALSELLARKMSIASHSETSDKMWSTAYAGVKSNSPTILSNLSSEMSLKALKDPGGKGLLTWSVINGATPDVVRYLIEVGCDVNEKDAGGNTPLLWSFLSGQSDSTHIRKVLIEHGADEKLTNNVGLSALSFSKQN